MIHIHMIHRNQIHFEFPDNHVHDRVILDLHHDPVGLVLVIAHDQLIVQAQVFHGVEKSANNVRPERCARDIEGTARHVKDRIRHVLAGSLDPLELHVVFRCMQPRRLAWVAHAEQSGQGLLFL